jgi:hypothetical protein
MLSAYVVEIGEDVEAANINLAHPLRGQAIVDEGYWMICACSSGEYEGLMACRTI